jgi:predicted transcriptional regulator of viral defense system
MKDTEQQHVPRGRARLTAVLKASRDVVQIDDACRALGVSRNEAAKLLSRWVEQGWLRRVGSGAYVPVPLDSLQSEHVLQDPWVLIPSLFSPAYVGGRTAAEHWDLTEQIFRDIVVVTGQTVRTKNQVRHGAQFTLKHVKPEKIFGTKSVWRGQTKILVSDVHRTIIDMLDDPAIGGGIQHVADCLRIYLKRPDRNNGTLIEYGARLGNRAVFKRLGFLAELNGATELATACKERLSQGTAKLDPALHCPRLMTQWRLWVPPSWADGAGGD